MVLYSGRITSIAAATWQYPYRKIVNYNSMTASSFDFTPFNSLK